VKPGGPGVTRFATRAEHRLSYESSGDEEGQPVLALHDLLVDRGQLRPLAATLADAGFRITLPDARGHGASPMLSGRGHEPGQLAADVAAILDAEAVTAAQIIAFGWSANIALTLAAIAPERAQALALVAPYLPALLLEHPDGDARRYGAALQATIQEAVKAASTGQTDRALDEYLGIRWGAGWRDQLSKPRLGAIRRAAANLGPLLMGMDAAQLDRDAWGRITVPVTILLRHDAPAFERWNAEVLADLIPGAVIQTATIASTEEGQAAVSPEWAPVLIFLLAAQQG
jgi:pimeloyl-ACP methyl ester carboxylesterase